MSSKTKRREEPVNGARPPRIPNTLSKQDRIQAIGRMLMNLQQQEFELCLQQTANNHSDDDVVPGLGIDADTGQPMTYGKRLSIFRDGQVRIATQHRDLMPQVQGFIQGLQAEQAG